MAPQKKHLLQRRAMTLQERLAKLAGGVAIIRVGGSTEAADGRRGGMNY
jgi:hypothetical protein